MYKHQLPVDWKIQTRIFTIWSYLSFEDNCNSRSWTLGQTQRLKPQYSKCFTIYVEICLKPSIHHSVFTGAVQHIKSQCQCEQISQLQMTAWVQYLVGHYLSSAMKDEMASWFCAALVFTNARQSTPLLYLTWCHPTTYIKGKVVFIYLFVYFLTSIFTKSCSDYPYFVTQMCFTVHVN